MTGLLVGMGLLGKAELAADIGIIQGAALALFFGFSGNARNVLLKPGKSTGIRSMLITRLVLMIPLGVGVFYLGSVFGGAASGITLILILRKCVEWISELHLSMAERERQYRIAGVHFMMQSILLAIVGFSILLDESWFLPSIIAWALAPLFLSLSFVGKILKNRITEDSMSWKLLIPHFGSTAVTGIGVYAFRISVLLMVGREDAGNLYTAFAIGGVLGSLFAFGFGPSLVLQEQRTGSLQMPRFFRRILFIVGGAGIGITAAFQFGLFPGDNFIGKSAVFWQTLGFSLVGSVVMVFAHRQRLRDLQHGTKDDVFAPDVLVNIIVVIFVPIIFYSFGIGGMTLLYLFNAFVALVFYWMTDPERALMIVGASSRNWLRSAIAFLLTLPVFFSLNDGLFRSPEFIFDSEGSLGRLPIPVSVAACYVGIALLGNFRRANQALSIVFSTFVLMVLSVFTTTYATESSEQGKLFLLLQYVLPMFALVLGMMYENRGSRGRTFERAFFLVVAIIVPLELMATWLQGGVALSPYVYVFSIYQHLQYVPVIMMTGYLLGLFSLWESTRWRVLIFVLTPVMAIYASASMSMAAVGYGVLGCLTFFAVCLFRSKNRGGERISWMPAFLFAVSFLAYNYYISLEIPNKFGGMYSAKVSDSGTGFSNVNERLVIWSHYIESFSEDSALLLFGHSSPLDREVMPSAHNYYLDFIYNFGLLAIVPILSLLGYTIWLIFRNWRTVILSRATAGFAFVVLVLLLAENNVKVGLRMPYSGIVLFFLWGLILYRLDEFRNKSVEAPEDKNLLSLRN